MALQSSACQPQDHGGRTSPRHTTTLNELYDLLRAYDMKRNLVELNYAQRGRQSPLDTPPIT